MSVSDIVQLDWLEDKIRESIEAGEDIPGEIIDMYEELVDKTGLHDEYAPIYGSD